MNATALPASSADPPPNATTPSWPRFDVTAPRIAPDLAEQRRFLERRNRALYHRRPDQALVGDDQRAFDAGSRAGFRKLNNAARPRPNRCRIVPIAAQRAAHITILK
jgi:hypothetical protein